MARRVPGAIILSIAAITLIGLFVFAERVRGYTPAPEPERADAIVALTGPSAERVNAAIRLLEQDKGKRVLISGVNREVRRQELRALTPGSNRLFNCCVDLGFEAEDTVGNAQEIAAWSRAKGYRSLIVVTSDYHMPRSLVEIRGQLPGVSKPLTAFAALVRTPTHARAKKPREFRHFPWTDRPSRHGRLALQHVQGNSDATPPLYRALDSPFARHTARHTGLGPSQLPTTSHHHHTLPRQRGH